MELWRPLPLPELAYYQVVTMTRRESLSCWSPQNGSFTMCGRLVKGVQSAFPVPTESEKLSFMVKVELGSLANIWFMLMSNCRIRILMKKSRKVEEMSYSQSTPCQSVPGP